ncbi:MAG: DUF973 family protein [Sulfolobales archaeon]|nr:DUF973 family protein [Sulfolobales archaeon]
MSSSEVKALQDLRWGSLYAILANVLLSISAALLVGLIISSAFFFSLSSPSVAVGSVAVVVILEIIALVFTVLSTLKLRSGFRGLNAIGKDVGGVTGTTLWIIGIILMITVIIPFIGFIAFVGAILIIVGLIIIGLAIKRVGEIYNVSNINIGGILIAIGSIIPFLAFIGFILTYMGLGKLLNTMGPGGQPPSGPSQGTAPTQ